VVHSVSLGAHLRWVRAREPMAIDAGRHQGGQTKQENEKEEQVSWRIGFIYLFIKERVYLSFVFVVLLLCVSN